MSSLLLLRALPGASRQRRRLVDLLGLLLHRRLGNLCDLLQEACASGVAFLSFRWMIQVCGERFNDAFGLAL